MPSTPYFSSSEITVAIRAGFETASYHEIGFADFNGDGHLDLVTAYFLYPLEDRGVPVRILLGDGEGGLTEGTAALFPGGAPTTVHARQIVLSDFNGDLRPDVYIADHGYDTNPFPGAQNPLMLSSGASGLVNATGNVAQITDFSHSAGAGDIDGDGDIDLYVNNYNGGSAEAHYLLFNNGAGVFTLERSGLPSDLVNGLYNSPSTVMFDLDNDDDLDIALGPNFTDEQGLRVLINDGDGGFLNSVYAAVAPIGVHDTVVDLQALDIDGNGWTDLILSVGIDNYAGGGQVVVLMNHDGVLVNETEARVDGGFSPVWVVRNQLADINADGVMDIVQSTGTAPILLGDGDGGFFRLPSTLTPNGPDIYTGAYNGYDKTHPADVNGDGRMDLVLGHGNFGGEEHFMVQLSLDPGAVLDGTGSGDLLVGDASEETFNAGGGSDFVFGATGDDLIHGGGEDDTLMGAGGNDTIDGGEGFDDLDGGIGIDTVDYRFDLASIFVHFGWQWARDGFGDEDRVTDFERVAGSDFADIIITAAGDNWASGNGGADWIEDIGGGADQFFGDLGDDIIFGGAGVDDLNGGDGADALLGGTGNDALRGGVGVDWIYGGADADVIQGEDGNDVLFGGEGGGAGDSNDSINGGAGDDALIGEAGNDTLIGGDGVDWVYGGAGGDYINGGAGDDVLIGGDGADGADGDDQISGGAGNDALIGQAGNDILIAEGGDDWVYGGAGNDNASGGSGNDVVAGENGDDTLSGGDGDDFLFGGYGNDTLNGGDGNDWIEGSFDGAVIHGGAGADSLFGGDGARFVYTQTSDSTEAAADTIGIFYRGGLVDRIDVSAIDADANAGNGDTQFSFVAGFTNLAGQAIITWDAPNNRSIARFDVNGDGAADMAIVVLGIELMASDFIA